MSATFRLLPLLLVTALLAGCGGSSSDDSASAPPPKPSAKATGGGSNPLTVGATDLRLGDATVAGPDGSTALKTRKDIDPGELRQEARDRQGVGAGAGCENADDLPSAETVAVTIAATLCLLNGERADAGLPALTENPRLTRAALEHSQDMVVKQYFDHQAPDGSDPAGRIRAAGYIPRTGSWLIGENLAWGTGSLATPRNTVIAWMKSQGHRENILRDGFREIGLGIVVGNPRSTNGSGATYTTTFGAISGGDSTARVSTGSGTPPASTSAKASSSVKGSSAKKKKAKKKKRKRGRKAKASKRSPKARTAIQ